MFEEILMSALSELDDDTLDYIIESCTDDELEYLSAVIEEISGEDWQQLNSGYKLDMHNGVKGFVKSFKNSGKDRWKNLAHDAKTEVARIKNNLKGDAGNVSLRLADKDFKQYKETHPDDFKPGQPNRALNDQENKVIDQNKDVQRNRKSLSYKVGLKIGEMKANRDLKKYGYIRS